MSVAVVTRSRRVTWHGAMPTGSGPPGGGYGTSPVVLKMTGALGSSSIAGMVGDYDLMSVVTVWRLVGRKEMIKFGGRDDELCRASMMLPTSHSTRVKSIGTVGFGGYKKYVGD